MDGDLVVIGEGDPTLMQSITSSQALNSSEADLDLLL